MRGRAVVGGIVASIAVGCSPSEDGEREVTWYGDVEPVVAAHCSRCHSVGGLGVGDFTDPAQAADYASLMLAAVDAGRMPPPASDPGCRDYVGSDAMTLDGDERDVLAAWVAAGAPLGDPADAGGDAERVDDALSSPDLELLIPAPYKPTYADADNADNEYRCFVLDPGHDEDFFVTAMAPIVDERSMVHHAVLLVKDRSDLRAEELAPEGVDCMGGGIDANGQTVVAWAPGMLPVELPAGTGVRVGADQVLILQLHYFQSPGSEGASDQSGYAFRTASEAESLAVTRQAGLADFEIPAGDPAYELGGSYTPRVDEEILGVFPHMHTLGERFHASVVRPDGTEGCLVDGAYDFDNQLTYQFLEAVPLGPDDRMDFRCTWNNSTSNPDVVGEPTPTGFGERTDQEMCVFFTLVREVGEATEPVAAEAVDPRALAAGAFQVNFASEAAGTYVEDSCVGEVAVVGEAPASEASGTCVLQGMLGALFGSDPKPVAVTGLPDGGRITVDLGGTGFESPWTSEIEGTAVYGSFDGIATITTDLGAADVSFAGAFHLDPAR